MEPNSNVEESEDDSDEQTASKEKRAMMTISTGAKEQEAVGSIQAQDPRLDLSNYKFPTLNLLKHYDNDSPAIDEKDRGQQRQIIHVIISA